MMVNLFLVGGWATPVNNMKVSWDVDIPNILEDTSHVPNHQPGPNMASYGNFRMLEFQLITGHTINYDIVGYHHLWYCCLFISNSFALCQWKSSEKRKGYEIVSLKYRDFPICTKHCIRYSSLQLPQKTGIWRSVEKIRPMVPEIFV